MNRPAFLKNPSVWIPACLILYTALIFRVVWPSGITLFAQDHNIALMAQYKAELPRGLFTGFWRATPFLGRMGVHPMTSANLLLAVLPLEAFFDWIYGAYLLAGSIFLVGFLRLRGLPPVPALIGALAAFWTGSNLTLAHPGHLEKFGVLCFAAATLYGIEKLFQTRRARWGAFTGGCLGMMAMHQGDVALFFALPLAAWFFFRGIQSTFDVQRSRFNIRFLLFPLSALSLFLLLMGLEAFRFAQDAHVTGVAVLEQASPEEQWNFATQWSWPPREVLDLIAPDFHGRWSGHETRPYTGIMGRSPEWETDRQGFPNFKLESTYLGLIPLALALFALLHQPRCRERRFWALAALIALLLAAGKFTPLYRLFYPLPLISSIRNPNKFLQVFQLLLGILAAFGAQSLTTAPPKLRKRFAAGLAVTAALLGLGGLLIQSTDPLQLRALQDTLWESQAAEILQGRQAALLHAALLGLITAALAAAFRPRFLAAVALLMALDGALLARHYLEPFSMDFMRENPVAEILKEHIGSNRVATLETDGLYEHLLHFVFPYHQIPHANLLTAPRLGSDIQAYLHEFENDPLRLWRDLGVSHVLMSDTLWTRVQQIPVYRAALHSALTYTFDGEDHHILELIDAPGRFQLDNGTLHHHTASLRAFTLELTVHEPGGRLRLADRYTPHLHAALNGQPLDLQREDLLFPVLDLPPGAHTLDLTYTNPSITLKAQQLGTLLWLVLSLKLLIPGRDRPGSIKPGMSKPGPAG